MKRRKTNTEEKKPRKTSSKSKQQIIEKPFIDVLNDRNKVFLDEPNTLKQLEKEIHQLQQNVERYQNRTNYLTHVQIWSMQAKRVEEEIKQVRSRNRLVLYLIRLGTLLHQFCTSKETMLPSVVDIELYLKEFDESKCTNVSTEQDAMLSRILTIFTRMLYQYREAPFPNTDHKTYTLQQVYTWWFDPMNNDIKQTNQKDTCEFCGMPLILQKKESIQTCKCSAYIYQYFNMNQSANDFQSKTGTSTQGHDYERPKFFEKWLMQYKGGMRQIPKSVISRVKRELCNMQILNPYDIKRPIIKEILQRLNLQQYVSQDSKIANIINGVQTAELTQEEFKEIFQRSKAVEEVFFYFASHPEKQVLNRINFPGFNYMVRQICMINRWHHLKRFFPLPKLELSRMKQEADWKLYIKHLKTVDKKHEWRFIPTK